MRKRLLLRQGAQGNLTEAPAFRQARAKQGIAYPKV